MGQSTSTGQAKVAPHFVKGLAGIGGSALMQYPHPGIGDGPVNVSR